MNELKILVVPSYASKATPKSTSHDLNISNEVNVSPLRENTQANTSQSDGHLNTQSTTGKTNGTNRSLDQSIVSLTVNAKQSTESNGKTHSEENYVQNSSRPDVDQSIINYKIPVRIQGNTEETKPADNNLFIGASRKRPVRYYLSGIDAKSSRAGIIRFLECKGVKNDISAIVLRKVQIVTHFCKIERIRRKRGTS